MWIRREVNIKAALQMREYIEIADRIAASRPGRVLDWGCGFGQMTHLLRERGISVRSYEFDPAANKAERELQHYPDVIADIGSDHVKLPYEDESFDAVLSCGVLEHVAFPDRSLDELYRVLRPSGTLYVYKLPNRWSYLEAIARISGLYYHGAAEFDRVYTLDSARKLVEQHQFQIDEIALSNMIPLTLTDGITRRFVAGLWRVNVARRWPKLLRQLATNIELIATKRLRRY